MRALAAGAVRCADAARMRVRLRAGRLMGRFENAAEVKAAAW
jgi:hypothetical protein